MIPNILADRYVSAEIKLIFDPVNKIKLERKFWLEVLKLQQLNGLKIPEDAIRRYESNIGNVNLPSIEAREKILKHDVKARIDEFNSLAGYELIHLGLTSRDVTENVELIQIQAGLIAIDKKLVPTLELLSNLIATYKSTFIVGRTHNVPAQITTLGKKFAIFAEEIIDAKGKLTQEISDLKFKGLKGAIGTKQDLLTIFDVAKLNLIERELAKTFGFNKIYDSVGQIYPRSQDFSFISSLIKLASGISTFALNIRLLAGHNQVLEGFENEQVGSSAMPHKRNPRSSERINGLMSLLRGYANIAAEISGNQWNEGDVSCSVVRRVIIPDSFFATDGILNSFYSVMKNLSIKLENIDDELKIIAPFLASSRILMESVKNGIGREVAHDEIKRISLASNGDGVEFLSKLSTSHKLGLTLEELENISHNYKVLSGTAEQDCDKIVSRINTLLPKSTDQIEIGEKY